MPDGDDALTLRTFRSIRDFDAAAWDALAGEGTKEAGNPFVCHAFLTALEDSRSACATSGWRPCPLGLFTADGRLIGAVPLYLKSHSYGEYVFDWGWAEAYERAGGTYYPKLQVAVPFTPVTGPRLLTHPSAPPETREILAKSLVTYAERLGVSSLHMTFGSEAECQTLAKHGALVRMGCQYHWKNNGYRSFDDFLGELSSRKRKTIRKEREGAAASGLVFRTLTGAEILPHHWDAFYTFYLDTVERKWAHAYLTRDFFTRLATALADRVVMIVAETNAGETVAGALNLMGPDTLYGRYWGCRADAKFLHFELCYYRAIDFAIARGLATVEAGAQGEHKIQRGYLPSATWSAHWIADAGFRGAVARFLENECQAMTEQMRLLTAGSPFRRDDGGECA